MDETCLAMDFVAAQQAVMGSIFVDDACVGAVLARLREEDFTDSACRNAFAAVKRLFTAGRPVDPITVQDAVGGGAGWLRWAMDLMDLTPTAANAETYADIVREKAAVHRAHQLAQRIQQCPTREEVQDLAWQLFRCLADDGRDRRVSPEELARDFIARVTSKERPEYLPWGLPTADRMLYTQPGDLVLLGGYPSAGKTMLSVHMALAQAKKYRVGYYSLETQPEKMADRIFAHMAGVDMKAIKKHSCSREELRELVRAANTFVTETPVAYYQGSKWSAEQIAASAVAHREQIIYIDYLQQVRGPGRDAYARVSAVSQALKEFAQSARVAVVALAQFSRPEKIVVKGRQLMVPPTMAAFRDSGQLEQDADAAFLLWPEDPNNNRSRRILKLGKNKEGEKFTRYLAFDGATQTFREMAVEPPAGGGGQAAPTFGPLEAANESDMPF